MTQAGIEPRATAARTQPVWGLEGGFAFALAGYSLFLCVLAPLNLTLVVSVVHGCISLVQ